VWAASTAASATTTAVSYAATALGVAHLPRMAIPLPAWWL